MDADDDDFALCSSVPDFGSKKKRSIELLRIREEIRRKGQG